MRRVDRKYVPDHSFKLTIINEVILLHYARF